MDASEARRKRRPWYSTSMVVRAVWFEVQYCITFCATVQKLTGMRLGSQDSILMEGWINGMGFLAIGTGNELCDN